ncbi:hypothetical protein BEP19_05600 [Ammoniphilus oxalaticus]|uniref:M23ase beta-sheet core domain-containing protein n=1 Tax=Ammoniphilus oxalaticus TaxID=66863 RepID=A0A419SIR0_9BACL|nr:M23 family metallopeptidase [Ammoniphilus oxalaticus]RKD23901.1 hypothetical protein BEP19_05600 [Ammoniphilus oxalaticus]
MSLESIRRRREARLRRLREEMKQETSAYGEVDPNTAVNSEQSAITRSTNDEWDFWSDEYTWDDEDEHGSEKPQSTHLLKTMISVFIVSVCYIIYHTDSPVSNQGKQFIGEVMTREFNFQGVVAEVENRFGINPTILPTIRPQSFSTQAVWTPTAKQAELLTPLKGEVTSTFAIDRTAIQIVAEDETVKAVDEGVVLFAGQEEEGINTITILHKSGTKTTYTGLNEIRVSAEDWVQPGQPIADMKPGSTLHFSMQTKDEYIDPMSVITFE